MIGPSGDGFDILESSYYSGDGTIPKYDFSTLTGSDMEALVSTGSGREYIFTVDDIENLTDSNGTFIFKVADDDILTTTDNWTFIRFDVNNLGGFNQYGSGNAIILIENHIAAANGFTSFANENVTETSSKTWVADSDTQMTFIETETSQGSTITGASGADFIFADDEYSSDYINGGAGNDKIFSGNGNDQVTGGAGADIMLGGEGTDDRLRYNDSSEGVTVNLASGVGTGGDAEGDVFSSFEIIEGSFFDDILTGDEKDNLLYSEDGTNTLYGGGGDDHLKGINHSVVNDDLDILYGEDGDDRLEYNFLTEIHGGDGEDTFYTFAQDYTIDLSQVTATNIEIFYNDSSASDFTLTLQDLIDVTDADNYLIFKVTVMIA